MLPEPAHPNTETHTDTGWPCHGSVQDKMPSHLALPGKRFILGERILHFPSIPASHLHAPSSFFHRRGTPVHLFILSCTLFPIPLSIRDLRQRVNWKWTGSPCISRLIQLPLLSPVYQPSELVSKRVSIYQDLVRASEDVKCEELQGCWNCRLMWGNRNHAVIPTKLSTNLFYF